MKKILFLMMLTTIISGCSAKNFWNNTEKTQNFFSDNLIFLRPENPYANKKQLNANLTTLQNAQMKRQEISYDPYYPKPKAWSEKPTATSMFP